MFGLGTIVNTIAVVAGGIIGLLFKNGLKNRYQETIMQGIGLAVLFVGISGAMTGMLTVSYTHLDVYKRQDETMVIRCGIYEMLEYLKQAENKEYKRLVPQIIVVLYTGPKKWNSPVKLSDYFEIPEELKMSLIHI